MKRHLIWIIAGTAAIGIAVPAFAAVQPSATPDDNGTPGEVRGNCDEAEHAGDAECLTVTVSAPSASTDADDDRDHRPERVGPEHHNRGHGPEHHHREHGPEHHDRQHRP